jgi:hypothetical protein
MVRIAFPMLIQRIKAQMRLKLFNAELQRNSEAM